MEDLGTCQYVSKGPVMSDVVLQATNVSVAYGRGKNEFVAVRDISLALKKSQTLGLVGESGSGKSTLGKALVGLEAIKTGTVVRMGGAPNISMVFQNPRSSFNPKRTIHQSLA